jgi:hypothetical protein
MKQTLALILATSLLAGCVVHERRYATPGVTPVSKQEVLSMTTSGYADDAILARIQQDGVDRRPSADDLVEMKSAGVSEMVMNTMMSAPVTVPRAPVEHSTVEVVDYTPAILAGVAFAAALFGMPYRASVHVHTVHCRH